VLAQVLQLDLVDVQPVNEHTSQVRLMEPQNEMNQRALARPGWPGQGADLAGEHLGIDILKQRFAVVVTEADRIEFDVATDRLERSAETPLFGRSVVHQVEHTIHTCRAPRQLRETGHQPQHGRVQHRDPTEEHEELAGGHRVRRQSYHLVGAKTDQCDRAGTDKHVADHFLNHVVSPAVHLAATRFVGRPDKRPAFAFLGAEPFDDFDTEKTFDEAALHDVQLILRPAT